MKIPYWLEIEINSFIAPQIYEYLKEKTLPLTFWQLLLYNKRTKK